MAEIIVVNTLEVETDIGKCQIQLCVGDITSLPKEDEVDVLVLSAFPGKSVISNRQTGCSLAYYNAIFQHNIALFTDKLGFSDISLSVCHPEKFLIKQLFEFFLSFFLVSCSYCSKIVTTCFNPVAATFQLW